VYLSHFISSSVAFVHTLDLHLRQVGEYPLPFSLYASKALFPFHHAPPALGLLLRLKQKIKTAQHFSQFSS